VSVLFDTVRSGKWVPISCGNLLAYLQSTLSTRKKRQYVDPAQAPTHPPTNPPAHIVSQPRLSQYES